jgi:hypothetical protein
MYPVDLLKVRRLSHVSSLVCCPHNADSSKDEDSNHQSVTRRHVQRYIERHGYHIAGGGLPDAMERTVKCCHGRRSVHQAQALELSGTD